MNKRYDLLTRCLSELKESCLPPVKKLQMEVQLYQLKRLLLVSDQAPPGGCAPDSERDLIALHHRIQHVCRPGREPGEANELIKHMTAMKEVLQAS